MLSYGQTSRLHVKNRAFDPKNWSKMMFFGSAGQNKGSRASQGIIPDPTSYNTFPPWKFFSFKKNLRNKPIYWGRDKIWLNPGYNQPHPWKFLLKWPLLPYKRSNRKQNFLAWNTPATQLCFSAETKTRFKSVIPTYKNSWFTKALS